MKSLWAPWRAEYIHCAPRGVGTGRRHCLFCRLLREHDDERNLIIHRGRLGFVVMNRYPYNNGHLMVAPNRHVATVEKLSRAEGAELLVLAQRSLAALRHTCVPHGFNLGVNLGRVAGAGVAGHVHLHIVPRWSGDTNFMPLLAETKVVSEHLEKTYRTLARRFRSAGRSRARGSR